MIIKEVRQKSTVSPLSRKCVRILKHSKTHVQSIGFPSNSVPKILDWLIQGVRDDVKGTTTLKFQMRK